MQNVDPIELELMRNLFEAAAEEMGITLQRVAFSANIKERRDFSCALFDASGELLAQAAHIPVHLGSMPASVAAVIERLGAGSGRRRDRERSVRGRDASAGHHDRVADVFETGSSGMRRTGRITRTSAA